MAHQGYGFCEFLTEEDAEYACKIMNQIKLWGKPIRVNKVRLVLGFLHCSRQQPRRPRLTRNNWMSERTFLLVPWTRTWTSDFCTIRSVRSV